jgi:hypothetical protein
MDLKVLHRVPEERISAVLGVPAIVAGLGAGLDRATYSNFREAREAFTETKLIPLWRSLAATLSMSLLPDFGDTTSTIVEFDITDVRALSDDQDAQATRLKTLVEAGIITVDEARAELGRPASVPIAAADGGSSPPAVRSRAPLVALPGTFTTATNTTHLWSSNCTSVETKAGGDIPDRLLRLREEFGPDWHAELTKHLSAMERRVLRRLNAGGDNAEDLVPETEATLLGKTLTPLQTELLGDVHAIVLAELGIEFGLDDPLTRRYLHDAGANIGGITSTTREAVRAALTEGQSAGEGIPALARRLRDLPAFGSVRAETVARTELAYASNQAALSNYRASGVVVGVRVHDGEGDAACAAMDGRVFPLTAPPPILGHPRCVRALAPITDAAELAASA